MAARTFSTAWRRVFAVGVLALALSACGGTRWGFPYRTDVQQGNWITTEQIELLRPGMSPEQVRFLLGTPTLQDVFREDRWDYPYYYQPGQGDEELRRFTVWFSDGVLEYWEGDAQPNHQPFERSDTGTTPASDTAQ